MIHLNISRAIVLGLPRCGVGRFALIESSYLNLYTVMSPAFQY